MIGLSLIVGCVTNVRRVMLCCAAAGTSYTDELRDTPLVTSTADSLLLAMPKSVSESDLMQGRRPQFVQRPPLEINVFEGEPLTLRCAVEGSPKPIGMTQFVDTQKLIKTHNFM